AGAAEHARRGGAGADGAGGPVHAVGAVAGGQAAEAVALHRAGGALALADGGDVDLVAVGQHVGLELLAHLVLGHVVEAELDEPDARLDARLLELPELGLGDLAGLLRAEGDLQGGVPVALVGLDLHDAAGLDPEDGHGDDAVVVVPDLGHPYLLAHDCLCRHDDYVSLFAAASGRAAPVHANAPLGRARRSASSVVPDGSRVLGPARTSVRIPRSP